MLHNLVGSGVSLDNFLSVLAHALSSCERTIVLEHNRESLDFREDSSTVAKHNKAQFISKGAKTTPKASRDGSIGQVDVGCFHELGS